MLHGSLTVKAGHGQTTRVRCKGVDGHNPDNRSNLLVLASGLARLPAVLLLNRGY